MERRLLLPVNLTKYIEEEQRCLRLIEPEVGKLLPIIDSTKGTIYTIGNGGSASTASHFVGDMVKTAKRKVISLCDNSGLITAISNDHHFIDCFEKQIEVLIDKEDLLIAISVSGDSLNLIRGVQAAKRVGTKTIGLLGKKGGTLKIICDYSVVVPSDSYEICEDIHLAVCHILAKGVSK